ncbi:hypothetical protein B296_00052637 [Ensete ventricosum]|uniref:Uncharacterized protein n=1 Tax=Ensete ventricosum TaxID=4639 RepID=A0A426XLG4_ENSVE|nr:hypothetical protein B296_00052637 [Ensete ventricosum]
MPPITTSMGIVTFGATFAGALGHTWLAWGAMPIGGPCRSRSPLQSTEPCHGRPYRGLGRGRLPLQVA